MTRFCSGEKNTKCHLSLSPFLQEQAVKSWDLPSEELVAYRYENVTPLFFASELACCISARSIYTVTTVVGVKLKNQS